MLSAAAGPTRCSSATVCWSVACFSGKGNLCSQQRTCTVAVQTTCTPSQQTLAVKCCCCGKLCVPEQDLGRRAWSQKAYSALCGALCVPGQADWALGLAGSASERHDAGILGPGDQLGARLVEVLRQAGQLLSPIASPFRSELLAVVKQHSIRLEGMSGTQGLSQGRAHQVGYFLCEEAQCCTCHNQQQRVEHDCSVTCEPQDIFLCR